MMLLNSRPVPLQEEDKAKILPQIKSKIGNQVFCHRVSIMIKRYKQEIILIKINFNLKLIQIKKFKWIK